MLLHYPTNQEKRTLSTSVKFVSCKFQPDDQKDCLRKNDNQIAKLAIVTLAAGVLTVGSVGVGVGDALAAKTGGRVGGQAFRSAPRSGPRSNSNSRGGQGIELHNNRTKETETWTRKRIYNSIPCQHDYQWVHCCKLGILSWTNIYINPPVAPPLVGGYGYGYGVPYYGGWGWSPFSFFAPGPSVAVGVGGGFDLLVLFMFIGAAAAVVRKFFGSKDEEDEY
ncbi:hypothetical protein Patl1_14227 [Pistacia atlantica]|uniref:Uncharacterized protein n=1 Tax=Pistacia atlantica TaxID=434234 RepID=A0ACC1AUE9_9ROSI|nr:hypothetical protein Patl1_14227 [Pistacia atlantica]